MNRTAVIYPALVVIVGVIGLIVLGVIAATSGPSDEKAEPDTTPEVSATAVETDEPEETEEPEPTQAPETEEPTEGENTPADEETATEEPTTEEPATEAPTEGTDGDTELTITAFNLLFDQAELTAPANTEITVVLVNEDAGVPHNISFYEDDSATEAIVVGELFTGVETREITFTTPDPGTYFFRCDVHPTTMVGDLIVE